MEEVVSVKVEPQSLHFKQVKLKVITAQSFFVRK